MVPAYRIVRTPRATLTFYHADCLTLLPQLAEQSVDAIVTSPPYNLGIQYRSYHDKLPREDYLAWTGQWIAAAARVLQTHGSLFLNVGAKPTDPWAAFDVAQAARAHLHLQNTIHWVKSIAIDRQAVGEFRVRRGVDPGHSARADLSFGPDARCAAFTVEHPAGARGRYARRAAAALSDRREKPRDARAGD